MPMPHRSLLPMLTLSLAIASSFAAAQTAPMTPDIPAKFTSPTTANDYIKREVEIPMRDGVKLHTVIVIPKGAKHAPILLTRTPYNASSQVSRNDSSHMASILAGYDNAVEPIIAGGYIRVVQDVRGKYGSEGDY